MLANRRDVMDLALALPEGERVALVEALLASFGACGVPATEVGPEVVEAWRAELVERYAA